MPALRTTLRLRLTLIFTGLVLAAGAALLALTYFLVERSLPDELPATLYLNRGFGAPVPVTLSPEAREALQPQLQSEALEQLLRGGLLALLVVGVASALSAYAVAGRVLRPLQQITATAQRLSTETLDARIALDGPADELKELADTFDAMLDRLTAAFGSQKRFVANASHELRTPLAVMRTEIDVTLADPDASREELRRMGVVVRDASRRANDLIEALLLLARTEAQAGRRLAKQVPVDLAIGVPVSLSAVRAEVQRLQLAVSTDFTPAVVVGDPALLERLAGNLVENAVRYNVAHGRLLVRTGSDGRYAYLVVANTGPELDPAEVPGLFEPFRRGGVERTGTRGSGLGLSIVRAVVDAHAGTVRALALPGGGLEVTVLLPVAATGEGMPGRATGVVRAAAVRPGR